MHSVERVVSLSLNFLDHRLKSQLEVFSDAKNSFLNLVDGLRSITIDSRIRPCSCT
jgi:hypothetical protein